MRAHFPPQAQPLDKGHGRIESRKLMTRPVDGATVGRAGAAQIFRRDRNVQHLRKGRGIKTTEKTVYGVIYEQQRRKPNAKKSLPDWQRKAIASPILSSNSSSAPPPEGRRGSSNNEPTRPRARAHGF